MRQSNIATFVKKIFLFILSEIERKCLNNIYHVATPKQSLEQWISELKNLEEPKGRVLITALRNYTWVEWAVYCAAVIRKMGYSSTLIFKESEISSLYNKSGNSNFWYNVKRIPDIELLDLEKLNFDINVYDKYYMQCYQGAVASLAYDNHVESSDILDDPETFGKKLNALQNETATNGARINKYLQSNKFLQFICYSGIISDTGFLLKGAIDANQEVVCVEGWGWRPGHMIFNFNSPALEYDINGWMNYFGEWDDKKQLAMSQYFDFLDGSKQKSEWLNNFNLIQNSKIDKELPTHILNFVRGDNKIFLLACNVIGDSSLLNRETIFRSHKEFIKKTIDYFSTKPSCKLIVRVHPGEEWAKGKLAIKLGEYSKELAGELNNILVIDSYEKLNTFALNPFVDVGLVWITSAGVDLVARGIPVIAAALPKYSGLGIVEEPKSQTEYFEMIESFIMEQKKPSSKQIQRAKEYLYMVFKGFSFEGQGRTFRADSCHLGRMPSQDEHDRFYRILLKLETITNSHKN